MSKELVIGSNRHETKVAVLEDDQVVEVYFQRANEYSLAGSVHKGRVTRVLPGMQSAFVDLGLERDTFLYVSDFFEEHEDIDTVAEDKPERMERRERNGSRGGERRGPNRPALAAEEPTALPRAALPREAMPLEEGERPVREEIASAAEPSEGRDSGAEGGSDREPQGDRRGRRSRRRRPRGGGFPDTKYARPSTAEPSGLNEAETLPDDKETTNAGAEVILLPGESLAKYRRVTSQVEPEEEEDERLPAHDDSHDEAGALEEESGEDLEESLAEQAEEIELADRVFAHHDDDVPTDREADPNAFKAVGDETAPPEGAHPVNELEPVVYPEKHEPSDTSVLNQEPIALDEYEVLAIQEGLTGIDEPVLDSDLATDDSDADASEASEEDAPEIPNAEGSAPQETAVQSASVREQNGPYMHRVSRRMRRRRGGNRGPQQPQTQDAVSGAEANRPEEAAVGSGAGAALAPDVRNDAPREERTAEKPERVYPSISDLLKAGQEIIVQIAKEPLGQKGARITSHIALPGRYVVFMPSVNHLGVSRKVASDEERQRLKRMLQAHRPGPTGGFIVRTAGEGVSDEEIAGDMKFLYDLWLDIKEKADKKPAPALLHYDLDIVQRILRDQVTNEFKAIWVDDEDLYESVVTFMQRFQPALVNRVKMYTRQAPIFDAFNITQELEKALRPKVWLKSGGYIVINQTEALVAIDINTGKYVGKSNRLEDTIVKTNTEAINEIVRQIRLRDLGGIIVVDFIDMDERKNRQKVMQALEEAMRADKAPYKILQFNDFGLVAITRKRVKQSLERTLCSPCPYCEAAGYVKSVTTVISEILVEAQKVSKAIEGADVVLRVHPEVAKVLKASDNQYLEELEEILKRPVLVTGDATLHHQKFDLA